MTKTPIQPPTRQDLLIFQGLQRAIVEKSVYQNRFQSVEQNRFSVFQSVGKRFAFAGDFNAVAGVDDCQQSDDGNDCFNGFGFGIRFLMPFFLEPFMQNRVVKRVVPRIEKFLIAWRYGGFSICLSADARVSCSAPQGDWRTFAESYFPDLIPADNTDRSDD